MPHCRFVLPLGNVKVQGWGCRTTAPAGVPYLSSIEAAIQGDPKNILDFGAEVELILGEGKGQEKHIIDTTSVVYIPKGLAHLPITFEKVDKPFLFGHLLLAPVYSETRD